MEQQQRVEAFRRLRSGIRGSEEYLVVGIDAAKGRHVVHFGTPQGKVVGRSKSYPTTSAGLRQMCARSRALQEAEGLPEVVFGVEPTGPYHKPWMERLIRERHTVVYVSTLAVKRNRELLDGRWDKHDRKDAANVSDLVGQGRCLYYDLPEGDLRELRSLLAFRTRLARQEHSVRMRLTEHLLAQYFPELEPIIGSGEPLFASVVWQCIDPRMIAAMSCDAYVESVTPRTKGKDRQEKLRKVWEAAADSIGCEVPEAAQWEARTLAEELRMVRSRREELDALIEEVASRFPEYRCLLSIPGFGPVVSAMALGAIGNPHRFNHPRQVLRLAGLDLCASRSGKTSNDATPRISKQGKAELRYALAVAATAAAKGVIIRHYWAALLKGREQEPGIEMKMKIKLASKLLVVAWSLMKRRESFDPTRLGGEVAPRSGKRRRE
jgi:transposase